MSNNFPKISLIISVALFILSCFLFIFLYRMINSNNQKETQATLEWQTEANRRDEVKELNNSVKIIEPERTKLETHFAKSSDIVPFLDTIEKLAPYVGAKAEVTSVNILADHNGLLVGIKASGNFTSLYKFLTLLENSPYELEFASMNMQREGEQVLSSTDAKIPTWSATFNVELLSFIK